MFIKDGICYADKLTVDEYIAKGYSREAAEYFANGQKKITDIVANDDFTLTLTYEGNEKRLFDVKPLLQKGTVFEPFMQIENFKRVYLDDTKFIAWDIDPNVDSNEVWNNKVDLCPDSCYIGSVPF